MNERIRLLAEQAFTITTDGKIGHVNNYMVEKFAELIVAECIDIAYEYDEPKLSGPGMIIGNRIEEHFGVEE